MTGWAALQAELDRWAEDGRSATFWWRDDDAVDDTPALRTLLDMRGAAGIPVALAVIPRDATEGLARLLAAASGIAVLQHGYAHADHSRNGRKVEFAAERPVADMTRDLAAGRDRMAGLFDSLARPVLVPPWNRIAPRLIELLPGLGFVGLSTYRKPAPPVAGLRVANTHIDIVEWRGSRGFVGETAALAACIEHLTARRRAGADAGEPTGLLTHHRQHDDACRAFVEKFLARTAAHPAARWLSADDVFGVR